MNKSKLSKVWNIITTALVALVVFVAVFLMGSRIIGFRVFTVISGSMEPTYSVGDLIYVQKVEPEQIRVGDPITFVLNEDLVVATHRVTRIDAENEHFYTKGDANDTEDASPVHYNNLIGRPMFAIPYLGYVSNFIQNPPGMYITIAIVVILFILVFLPDFLKKKEPEKVVDEAVAAESEAMAAERAELEKMKAELEAQKAALEAQMPQTESPSDEPPAE